MEAITMSEFNLQDITRITCSPDGSTGVNGNSIAINIAPATVQSTSAPITFNYNNAPLFQQTAWKLTHKDLNRYKMKDGEINVFVEKTVDGERFATEDIELVKIGEVYEGEITFDLPKDYRIFGLGQHENGVYDYRGNSEYLYQNNMKIPMPVFLCAGKISSFAVFFDAGCLMTFAENNGTARLTFDAVDRLNYYVIAGDSLDEVTRQIRILTGTAVMLPKWAFGYIQSRERYKTQAEVLEIVQTFEDKGIPLSCIVQDWATWAPKQWGNKTVDRERYPDIKAMMETLHAKDVAFMVSLWPNPSSGSNDNAELNEIGALLADASTYDAFNEEARALYWKQCERDWFAAGTDAWWCDSTEPFTPDWDGYTKKTDLERYEITKEKLAHYLDSRNANEYALMHAKGIYENQRKASTAKRVANLTRSGYPGIQQYGAILWSGDVCARWDVLRSQIAEGLNISAAGIPYWTTDIGAFFVGKIVWESRQDKTPPWFWNGDFDNWTNDMGYRELYVRWLQWGTFLPLMRSHGTDTPREPWFFGNPGEKYYDTILKYIKLRYKLLPYIYSLAGATTHGGYTMMRNLAFDFPTDDTACSISTQYMFGPAFLVCPVTEAMEFEADNKTINKPLTQEVYLPKGNWYDYETKQYLAGGQTITADAPINKMPLFVRAGSIIPISNGTDGSTDMLEIYAGESSTFTLYFDNGRDYAYENGDFAAVTLVWDDSVNKLGIINKEGSYPIPSKLKYIVFNTDGTTNSGEISL